MNDTYFGLAKYNTPAWKRLVVCQEVAHTLGLDHQDEIFNNPNLGTCMDYTDNPAGPPSNEHPNAHDYAELEAIYSQTDGFTTVSQTISQLAQNLGRRIQDDIGEIKSEWGRAIKDNGNVGLFERDFGMGQKVFTFVIWASE